jgi:hypothetical protein
MESSNLFLNNIKSIESTSAKLLLLTEGGRHYKPKNINQSKRQPTTNVCKRTIETKISTENQLNACKANRKAAVKKILWTSLFGVSLRK